MIIYHLLWTEVETEMWLLCFLCFVSSHVGLWSWFCGTAINVKTISRVSYHLSEGLLHILPCFNWTNHFSFWTDIHWTRLCNNQVSDWGATLQSLYIGHSQRMTSSILNDVFQPLHNEIEFLPFRRRFAVPRCRTKRYRKSFVPAAIIEWNKSEHWATEIFTVQWTSFS